jgi:hypothetical protein
LETVTYRPAFPGQQVNWSTGQLSPLPEIKPIRDKNEPPDIQNKIALK